jgi:hypothetical protein
MAYLGFPSDCEDLPKEHMTPIEASMAPHWVLQNKQLKNVSNSEAGSE